MDVFRDRSRPFNGVHAGNAWWVRAAWAVYFLLLAGMTLPGLGPALRLLQTPCADPACLDGQEAPEAAAQLLAQGVSMRAYALLTFLSTVAILLVGLCLFALIVWLRPGEPYPVLVAVILAALGVSLTRGSLSAAPANPQLQFLNDVIWYIQGAGLIFGLCLLPDGAGRPRLSL